MVNEIEVVVVAEMTAQQGQRDALLKILEAAISPSRAEGGNLIYRLHESRQTPGHFFFYELWRDQAAIDGHMTSAHFKSLVAAAGPLLAGAPQITSLKALTE